jgi:small subunit ribosomal protein S6
MAQPHRAEGFRPFPPDCISNDSWRGMAWGHVSDRQENERMALYEHVFLARQDLAQAQVDALAEAATKIVTDGQGTVTKTETWGLRSLAYRIAKNRKAHYVMLEIDAPGTVVAELERQTQINEDVIRFMTVKVDEAEAGPSVMMRKQERDRERRADREGSGGGREGGFGRDGRDGGRDGGRDRDSAPRPRRDEEMA